MCYAMLFHGWIYILAARAHGETDRWEKWMLVGIIIINLGFIFAFGTQVLSSYWVTGVATYQQLFEFFGVVLAYLSLATFIASTKHPLVRSNYKQMSWLRNCSIAIVIAVFLLAEPRVIEAFFAGSLRMFGIGGGLSARLIDNGSDSAGSDIKLIFMSPGYIYYRVGTSQETVIASRSDVRRMIILSDPTMKLLTLNR
jgi:hypothetical protein